MEAEKVTSIPVSQDAEWVARHARLDASLAAVIRTPVVDGRFAERVWALIHADEARAAAVQQALRVRLGTPWWLASLNVIAVAVTIVAVALAAGVVVSGRLAESVAVSLAFLEQPSSSLRLASLIASAAGVWLGLRWVPLARASGSAWL
jgi:hypothetical protein